MRHLSAAFAALFAVAAAPPPEPDLAALFGARPNVSSVALSPDGRTLAYITPTVGQHSALAILDIDKRTANVVLRDPDNAFRLRRCEFKTDTRLICTLQAITHVGHDGVRVSRLIAVNRDGSHPILLGEHARNGFSSPSFGAIVDWLPDDPQHLLMEVGRQVKVDVNTGMQTEAPIPVRVLGQQLIGYQTDAHANIRLLIVPDLSGVGLQQHRAFVNVLAKSGGRPHMVSVFNYLDPQFEPLGFDDSGDWLLALKPLAGRKALYRIAADGSNRAELMFASPTVDIEDVLRIGKYRRPVAASYVEDAAAYHYFDPALARLGEQLGRATGGDAVEVIDESWDGGRKLAFAHGSKDAGRYFLYETAAHRATSLLPVRPELDGRALAEHRAVTFPAADGVQVPAILTLPPGRRPGAPGPALLMPHGGPSARDSLGYDWLAQYWAAMGFVVLQPNYRGSSGYGDAWFQKNGFQSWQTAMADINAGARWLIAQGYAARQQLAIFGWSYGGYAALEASVVDPSLYKAIVAVAPVTDLALLTADAQKHLGGWLVRDEVGRAAHVRESSPARNAERIAAPVLMFQGLDDLNVNPDQARAMDAALAKAGKPHELVTYPGLDHQLDDGEARADMLRRSAAFLAEHIGPVTPAIAAASAPK